MPLRRSSIVLGVIGAALIISALLVELVAVPILTRLPGSLDVTLHYTGTSSRLNAQAMHSGDSAHLFLTDAAHHDRPAHQGGQHHRAHRRRHR